MTPADHPNPYMAWVMGQMGCAESAPLQVLSRLGQAASNDPAAQQIMRAAERGGMLDVHHGETGYTRVMAPTFNTGELLWLASTTKNDPRIVTVGINIETLVEAVEPPPADHRLQLLARWGTGKGVSSAVLDARHGTQFTVTANTLVVEVRYLGTNGPTVRVSASVAYGSPQGCDNAVTFTEAEVTLLGGGGRSAPFRIPAYATRVAWFSPDIPGVPAATIQQIAGAGLGSRIVSQAAPVAGQFIVIQNGADFVRIVNNAQVGGVYFVIYELHI